MSTAADNLPARFAGLSLLRVRGESMAPTLSPGDRLLVRWRQVGAADLEARLGRLVIVRLPDGRPLSVKRLVGRDPENPQLWWVERDNPRAGVDSWQVGGIAEEDVLAVVWARIWPAPSRGLTAQ